MFDESFGAQYGQKKPRNRANKIKGYLPGKPFKLRSPIGDLSDDMVDMMFQLKRVKQHSNFDVALPIVGKFYWGRDVGLFSSSNKFLLVESCSERDEQGDFQVVCYNEMDTHQTFNAKEWECERLIIGNNETLTEFS
ncbi:hypothetical protein BTO01_29260 [Vibrio jasicida]|uniref:hypothetical protein n=1 Tax=Vibrio jasicida TaxID=766224 RepID=UPI000CF4173B|nr:hypothetical protein [Vibrio jasicida]PQJ44436.1 hypothetical protein BTO01_29260 [Vibrio jasicida]